MKLSTLSMAIGGVMAALNFVGVWRPETFARAARKFPRSIPAGYFLMILGTVWIVHNLQVETNAELQSMKGALSALFLVVGIATCVFVKDFLAVRGFAIVLLLLAQLVLETARWVDTEWRLVMVVMAYLWVIIGIWFTVSPWRLRDALNWKTATVQRTRTLSMVRCAFGVFLVIIGFTVYRRVEDASYSTNSALRTQPQLVTRPIV